MFGSPKSIAKTMVRSYMAYRTRFPELSKEQILRKTLEARYPPGSKHAITWEEVANFREDIRSLTCYVVSTETESIMNAGPRHLDRVWRIVDETVERYVPDELR